MVIFCSELSTFYMLFKGFSKTCRIKDSKKLLADILSEKADKVVKAIEKIRESSIEAVKKILEWIENSLGEVLKEKQVDLQEETTNATV